MAPDMYAHIDSTGFVVMPTILEPSTLSTLRNSCAASTSLARSGGWPHIRTLPKQFPPWPSDPSSGIWGVQHLLHPSQPNSRIYAESYFSPKVMAAAAEIMDCEEGDLVMELYNLLVRPERDFELRWHRDDIGADATREEEERRLCSDDDADGRRREYAHVQWNLALWEDESLVVVPGSHRRARTEAERKAGPYDHLEGQLVVKLQPGDAVFYDNNILHRGVYKADRERMTLHGSMGRVGRGEKRARNVLQHGVGEWVDKCDFSSLADGVGERAEGMRQRLVEMGKGRKVEYSQPD